MRRAEIQSPRGDLTIRNYEEIPAAPVNGLVVKTSFCGICHSDLHMWERSNEGHAQFPAVLGHEIAGEVYSLGPKTDTVDEELEIGDRVIVYPWIGCEKCEECRDGFSNLCAIRSLEIGFGRDGGYSSHVVVVHRRFAVKVPSELSLSKACMLPCSGLTTYNAVSKIRPSIEQAVAKKGKASLMIVGAGGLGLWCLQMARQLLPPQTKIISVDIDEKKLEIASKNGAHDTVLWQLPGKEGAVAEEEELIRKTREKGYFGGIDGIIDYVNSSVTTKRDVCTLKKDGTMVLVGLFGGELPLDLPNVVRQELHIHGSYVGSREQLISILKVAEKLKPPPVTLYKLEEVPKAWKKLFEGTAVGRGIIEF